MNNPIENDMARHGSKYISSILKLYLKEEKDTAMFFYNFCPVTQLVYVVFAADNPMNYLNTDGQERYKIMLKLFKKYGKYKPAFIKKRKFTLDEFYSLLTEDAIFCCKIEKEFKKTFARELTLINILG